MSDSVRAGLVGYGMAGREIHAPLLRATERLQVTHVVTSNAERAASAAREMGSQVVPTFAQLLASAGALDLVVIASPTHLHAEQAREAVERGVAVVIDKPLATNLPDAQGLVDLAAAREVPLTVFQNRRWDSEHLTAKRLVAEGTLGDLVRYEARYERWRPEPKSRWRETLTTDEGGGLLHDIQSHLVDGAVDLLGPTVAVYAEIAALSTVGDDVTFLALEHQSGVHSHLGATSLAAVPGPRTRLLGRGGAYVVANVANEPSPHTDWRDADDEHRGWLVRGDEREPVRREPGGWADYYPAVVAMLRDGSAPPVDPRVSVHVIEILDAARRSAHERSTVRLNQGG